MIEATSQSEALIEAIDQSESSIQARVIDKRRRDMSLAAICEELGPSDGTVVVTPCTGSWAVSLSAIGGNLEEVVGAVNR